MKQMPNPIETILEQAAQEIKSRLTRRARSVRGQFYQFRIGHGSGAAEVPALGQLKKWYDSYQEGGRVDQYVRMLVPGRIGWSPGSILEKGDVNKEFVVFTPEGLYRCPGRVFFHDKDRSCGGNFEERFEVCPAWDSRKEHSADYCNYGPRLYKYLSELKTRATG